MTLLLTTLCLAWAGPRGVITGAPAPAGLDAAYAPRRVALVVGIDAYDDPALGGLRYAAKDARDLAGVLVDPVHGDFDVVSELVGDVNSRAFWEGLGAATAHLHRDDTFFLYIAAHGTLDLDDGTRLYVMPSDGELDRIAATGIALSDIEAALARLPSRRRVLALDSCHSGVGRSVISDAERAQIQRYRGPIPAPVAAAVSESEVRLYSAHFNQPALEDERLENGVYTHFFIEALTGPGDMDLDGLVEVYEAHNWARDRTLDYTGGTQVPWMQSQLVGRESVYLAGDPGNRRAAERALLAGLEALPARAVITVDGVQRGAGSLEPGLHQVSVALDDRSLVDHPVRVAAGDTVSLDALLDARHHRWLVEAGGSWNPGNDWIPGAGAQLGGWWMPADRGGGRLALGGQATYGLGDFLTGQALGQVGWWWGERWMAGPTASAGWLWRVVSELEDERQGALALAPGVTARFVRRPIQLGLQASALTFAAEDGRIWLPRASLSAGLAF